VSKTIFERLLITGGSGMVGSALHRCLKEDGWKGECFDADTDLRDQGATEKMMSEVSPSHVVHLAARVGGVKANLERLAEFYVDNVRINTNVLDAAHKYGVKKVLSLSSTCVYPDKTTYPLVEENMHNGFPHPSNYAYACTKRMLEVQSKAYRDQFGDNFIVAIPNNLFGVNDNFSLEDSHVIPATIRKMHEARIGSRDVVLWGDGSPLREFTYVDDLARILLLLLSEYNGREPLNVGNTEEYTIKEVAETVARHLGFSGRVVWNASEPSGQQRKPSSNAAFMTFLESTGRPMFKYTALDEGLGETCRWFVSNYPNVRGVLSPFGLKDSRSRA
jgi:GDP-L-fucose synthase